MLWNILIVIAAVIALLLVVVALQPGAFRVVRTATMRAAPPVVFAQVNDFHNWYAWSPWAKRDPAMKLTIGGAPAGKGASYAWRGNREVGEGRMTITESRPHDLVRIKLEFLKPFAATNVAEFTFEPQGDETLVTWAMTGQKNFVMKAFCLFMNMDKMIGPDFEKGLAQMKSVVEQAPAA